MRRRSSSIHPTTRTGTSTCPRPSTTCPSSRRRPSTTSWAATPPACSSCHRATRSSGGIWRSTEIWRLEAGGGVPRAGATSTEQQADAIEREAGEPIGGYARAQDAFLGRGQPWPENFPNVVVQRGSSDKLRMRAHPDYAAAKAGDLDAARRVVRDTLNPARVEELRALIGDRRPIVVPVHAEEAAGRNKLPVVY